MNNLPQIFNYQQKQVRTVIKDNEPWFVARDICDILEITDAWNVTQRLSDSMKGTDSISTPGGMQEMIVINETGVYKLVFTSRKPEAEKFTDWIACEVLPSIRKHGMYAKEELLDNPDLLLDVIQKLKQEREEKKLLADKLEQQKPLVVFAETCIASNDSILVRELAKLASKNGIVIGEKRLYKKLREWGLILNRKNEPSQKAMDAGYFEVKKGTYNTPYGGQAFSTSMVTPKGQVYIIEKLRKEA